jgi:preprotein translocase subunit SecD
VIVDWVRYCNVNMINRAAVKCLAFTVYCLAETVLCSYAETRRTEDSAVSFRLAFEKESPDTTRFQLKSSSEILHVSRVSIISDADIVKATVERGMLRPILVVTLTPAGGKRLSETTASNLESRLGIIVDGSLISAPTIRQRIDGNQFTINTDRLSKSDMEALALRINAVVRQKAQSR